jgi:hypothetical protein
MSTSTFDRTPRCGYSRHVKLIKQLQIVEKGWLIKIHALRLFYFNPASGNLEMTTIAKVNFLGLSKRKPVEDLRGVLEAMVESLRLDAAAEAQSAKEDDAFASAETISVENRSCESCGTQPCYYVGYVYQLSLGHISYRSVERRRLHCARCNLKMGLPYYLVTMLIGWTGHGIFTYPFVLYRTAKNLKPAIGNAFYGLCLLPILLFAALILRICNVI